MRLLTTAVLLLVTSLFIHAQTNKAVLTMADLPYRGRIEVPVEATAFSRGNLTHRYVNGQLHFLITGHAGGTELLEIDAPPPVALPQPAHRAVVLKNWGSLPIDDCGGDTCRIEDLEWIDNRLAYVWNRQYNVTFQHLRSLGAVDLSGAAIQPLGLWQTDAHSHQTGGYLATIPQWFADQYTGGKRLALGAGYYSGLSGSSWGPNLYAAAPPTASTTGVVPTQLALMYPFTTQTSPDHRLTREPTYVWNGPPDIPPAGDTGWFTQIEQVRSAAWVDTPDKHAAIFFGSIGTGHVWYGAGLQSQGAPVDDGCGGQTTGPHAEHYSTRFWGYDPLSLMPVLQGGSPWLPQPAWTINPNTAIPGFQMGYCFGWPSGSTFDATTGTLYLYDREAYNAGGLLYYGLIHAFGGSGSAPPPPPQQMTFTVTPVTVAPGAAVTVAWSGVPSPTVRDWIGRYLPTAGNQTFLDWKYTSCTQTAGGAALMSGSCVFTAPTTTGAFEMRFLVNDGFTSIASAPLTVSSAPPPSTSWTCTIPASVTAYANGDKKVTLRCPPTFTPVKNDSVTVTKP